MSDLHWAVDLVEELDLRLCSEELAEIVGGESPFKVDLILEHLNEIEDARRSN